MAQTPHPGPRQARQPFTLGGVARYAHAPPARLFASAGVFALLCGISFALLFARCLAPVLGEAVANLPEQSLIRSGQLYWPVDHEPLLGANAFLSLSAAPDPADSKTPVDFSVQFARTELIVRSLLGAVHLPYPSGWTVELNRRTLLPLWGAWAKPAVFLAALGGGAAMILVWFALALPYAIVVAGLGSLLGKDLGFGQAWKMSVAAQWPGAVLMAFVLSLYALGQTSLVLAGGAFALHFALTILYLFFAPIFLPQAGANPFSTEPKTSRASKRNPFQGAE